MSSLCLEINPFVSVTGTVQAPLKLNYDKETYESESYYIDKAGGYGLKGLGAAGYMSSMPMAKANALRILCSSTFIPRYSKDLQSLFLTEKKEKRCQIF
jgi:hypothetical protein